LTSVSAFPQAIHGVATKDSLPRIAIAVIARDDDSISLLVIDGDGQLEMLAMDVWEPKFTVGLRYDPRSEMWLDTGASAGEEEEE
jgi:hypothetical protein